MMKRLLSFWVALLATTALWAYDFQEGDLYYDVTSDSTVAVTYQRYRSFEGYQGYEGQTSIIIPEAVTHQEKTYQVTSIGRNTFNGCDSLMSIILSNTIKSIGDYAFTGCSNLTSIAIPDGVTSIEERAFNDCSNLASVTIPGSMTYIGYDAFWGCTNLTKVNYTGDIAGWVNIQFGYADSNPVTFSHNLYINDTLLTEIILPDSITSIKACAFYNDTCITSVIFTNPNTNIGSSAFRNCLNLSTIIVSNNETEHPKSYDSETTLSKVGSNAFEGCKNLISVSLPDSIARIEDYAFEGCSNLSSIAIPAKTTYIGKDVFRDCKNLTKVNYLGDIAGWTYMEMEDNPIERTHSLHIKGELLTDLVFPDGINVISNTFNYDTCIISVTIPEIIGGLEVEDSHTTYTVIVNGAFSGCTGLESITISKSITSIGDWAFNGCTNLKKVNYTGTATEWANMTFGEYNSSPIAYSRNLYINDQLLTDVVIDEGAKSISTAFSQDTCITSISIPNSVSSIVNKAFYGCTGLTSIKVGNGNEYYDSRENCNAVIAKKSNALLFGCNTTIIPQGVTSITECAFEGYKGLKSIDIPNSVTSIGRRAFYNCANLASVTIPNSVTKIGAAAFYGTPWYDNFTNGAIYINRILYDYKGEMPQNTSFVVKDGTIQIGAGALSGCKGLSSITIPESVESIGSDAFRDTNLEKVNYLGDVAGWLNIDFDANPIGYSHNLYIKDKLLEDLIIPEGITHLSGAFRCDTCLTSVTIANSVTSIDENAFLGCTRLASVTIGNGVTSIPEYMFNDCISLSSVTIGSEVTNIEGRAFYGCKSLGVITIPDNVVEIRDYAFAQSGLKSIILGSGVKKIGYEALWTSSKLSNIYALSHTPPTLSSYAIGDRIKVFVHKEDVERYKAANIWRDCEIIPLDSIALIPSREVITQTAARIDLLFHKFAEKETTKIGYALNGTQDTVWQNISDTTHVLLSNLVPEKKHSLHTFVETTDSVFVDSLIFLENFSNGWSSWTRETSEYGYWQIENNRCNFRGYGKGETRYGWLFHEIQLQKGEQYRFRIRARRDATYDKHLVKMCIGTENKSSAMTSTIIPLATPNYEYEDMAGIYTSSESETYYIGVYAQIGGSRWNTHNIYFDNISVYAPISAHIKKPVLIEDSLAFYTLPVSIEMRSNQQTQSTIALHIEYDCGDATNTGNNGIQYCKGDAFADNYSIMPLNMTISSVQIDTAIIGLSPDTTYSVRAYIVTVEGDTTYSDVRTYRTKEIDISFQPNQHAQTTATFHTTYDVGDLPLVNSGIQYCTGSSFSAEEAQTFYFNRTDSELVLDTIVTGLTPNTEYTFRAFVETKDEKIYSNTTQTLTTLPVTISAPTLTQYGQTYMLLSTSCNYGDATLVEEAVEYGTSKYSSDLQKASVSNSMVKINNLLPDTRYYYRSLLTTAEGGTIYSDWQEMTTKAITLSTSEADGISAKSVFLHGTIDCDMESRSEIGFEWIRSDAPSTVKPQRVLVVNRVDSNIVFRLEGLSRNQYYNFRTFCLYKEKTYYGEWAGFLTADDDVLVAPSVQTLGAEVSETGVELKGFVVAGTENIIQEGFESWRKGTTDVATTVSTGAIMTNEIPEPWSYTTYQYRAYAKTPSGTTYGETKEVTTGYIHTDIQDVVVTPSATTANVTWTIVEQADYYILTLFGNAEMTDTLATYTVDTEGNITQRRAPAALRALVNCNIDQLTPETDYFFTVIAYNADEQKVAEENGTFTTTQKPTTALDNVEDTDPNGDNRNGDSLNGNGTTVITARKIFLNGQVYILRNGKTYTTTGVEVK